MDASSRVLCCLITLEVIPNGSGSTGELVREISVGNYVSVLRKIQSEGNISISAQNAQDYVSQINSRLSSDDALLYGIAAFQLFLQSNVTGPAIASDQIMHTLPSNVDVDKFQDSCLSWLTSDGEPAYGLMSFPHLLVLALGLFSSLSGPFARWWYARALVIHQAVLFNPSASIHDSIQTCLSENTLRAILDLTEFDEIKQKLTTRFYCESARAQIVFGHEHAAERLLKKAQESSKLSYVLTGVSAKRTKFQQHLTSQLVFLAKSIHDKPNATMDGPESLRLNSELLLEKPHFSAVDQDATDIPEELRSMDPNDQPALLDIDTAIILLRVAAIRKSTPHKDLLIQEELLAMVSRIINSPQSSVNWSLFSMALWVRSLLEADSVKTVERGTLQMQSLVEELGQSTATYIPKDSSDITPEAVALRLAYVHQLMPLPKWSMDIALAEKFMSLGVLKSATEVYERLQMWGEVALCYAAVGQNQKGIEVLQRHLDSHPDDYRGISIMGDIKCDPVLWEKAWQVGKYPAAKRSLGKFYYSPPKSSGVQRNLDLAIKHLHDSLKVNPLNDSAWFLYGCAGLETSQWELAAEAFTRCVAIEEDDPKSWSNLATALLRLNKKQEAFNALRKATRAGSDNPDWRIWSNYVVVAADLREWNEMVRGLKQIVAMRADKDGERCLDLDLLDRLVQVLVGDDYIGDSEPLSRANYQFQKTCVDLFVNIIPSLITSDARLWKLVAKVHIWQRHPWAALEDYEKGFRIYTRTPLVESSDQQVWNEAVDFCSDLIDAYTNFGPMEGKYHDGTVVCKDWKFKARSCVRLLMGRGKNYWEDSKGWEKLVSMKEDL
jgi:tetratricopeptide (TPR) repeat protein